MTDPMHHMTTHATKQAARSHTACVRPYPEVVEVEVYRTHDGWWRVMPRAYSTALAERIGEVAK